MLALLLTVACVKSGALPREDAVDHLTAAPWTEICPGSDPLQTWLKLEENGTFAFAYPGSAAWVREGDETWTLDGDALTISWNGGFATTVYTISAADQTTLSGVSTKSCGDKAQLVAAPEGPDFSPGPTGYEGER